jgi:hypothetical protein
MGYTGQYGWKNLNKKEAVLKGIKSVTLSLSKCSQI